MITVTEKERMILLEALFLYMTKAKSIDEMNEVHDLRERFRLAEVVG